MCTTPFTRPTVVAAVELLEQQSQASFNQMVLRLGSEQEIPSSTEQSVKKKCVLLGRIVMQRPTEVVETIDGNTTFAEAVIREAVQLAKQDNLPFVMNRRLPYRRHFSADWHATATLCLGMIALFESLQCELPIRRVIVGPSRNQDKNFTKALELLGSGIKIERSDTPFIERATVCHC
jgi:hypothetical protein